MTRLASGIRRERLFSDLPFPLKRICLVPSMIIK